MSCTSSLETPTNRADKSVSLDIQYIMGPAPHVKTEFWLWKGMDFCGDLVDRNVLSTSSPPLVHSVSYGWQGDLSALNCEQDKIDVADGDFTKLALRNIDHFRIWNSDLGTLHRRSVVATTMRTLARTGTGAEHGSFKC